MRHKLFIINWCEKLRGLLYSILFLAAAGLLFTKILRIPQRIPKHIKGQVWNTFVSWPQWQRDGTWSELTSLGTGRRLANNPGCEGRDVLPLVEIWPKNRKLIDLTSNEQLIMTLLRMNLAKLIHGKFIYLNKLKTGSIRFASCYPSGK